MVKNLSKLYITKNNIEDMFNKFPILSIDGFKLREINHNDWMDIVDIYSNKELCIVDRIPDIYGKSSAICFIEFLKSKYNCNERIDWVIESVINKKIVGIVGIYNISIIDSKAEIGYVMNKNYMKEGIMTRALIEIINYLIKDVNINRIEANVYKENLASIRLCEKIGFKKEGLRIKYMFNRFTNIYMDSYIFSIIK